MDLPNSYWVACCLYEQTWETVRKRTYMNTDINANIKISVIMPVYNRAKSLPKAVYSVLNQTLREIELVCVNDGSTDNTLKVLKELAGHDPRIRIFSQRNMGSGAARNKGLQNAKGEFVAFLDSDDWYGSMRGLEKLYDAAVKNKVKICLGNCDYLLGGKLHHQKIFRGRMLMKYKDYQETGPYVCGIYDRHMLLDNEIFFPDYRRYQDPPFFVKVMICAGEFYAIPDAIYVYDPSSNRKKIRWNREKIVGYLNGTKDIVLMAKEHTCVRLQRKMIEESREGSLYRHLYSALYRDWNDAKAIMEKMNDNFLESAMQEYGLHNGEKPFDKIIKEVYGNNFNARLRDIRMRIAAGMEKVKQMTERQ